MAQQEANYTFPWGFHLGDLVKNGERMPLYTPSNDGGFCLLYDKASERKVDRLIESLTLELLSTMPKGSLKVDLFDFGKKKFYSLSPLQYMEIYKASYNKEMIEFAFELLENTIIGRHTEILCCNRPNINEHNQKSKMKMHYHLLLMNLENFPNEEIELRRIQNFVESAALAGVYLIAFGYHEILESQNAGVQIVLKQFKHLKVKNNEFEINKEIFEFMELLKEHKFEPLDSNRDALLQTILANADLESMMDPKNIKLESNTKVI